MKKLFLPIIISLLFLFLPRQALAYTTSWSISNPAYTNSDISIAVTVNTWSLTGVGLSFNPTSGQPTYVSGASVQTSGTFSNQSTTYTWTYHTTSTVGTFTVTLYASGWPNVGSTNFTTQNPAPTCSNPATPSGPSPANGATGVSLTPTFSWTESNWGGSPAPSGCSSLVYIYNSSVGSCGGSAFAAACTTGSITSTSLSNFSYLACSGRSGTVALSPSTTYGWNVGAYNACGKYTYNANWSFATTTNPPPTCSLSANPTTVAYNTITAITWGSTNATSCTVSIPGNSSWATGTSGSQSTTTGLTQNTTFTESCSGAGGSCNAATTVVVDVPPTVTNITISNPTVVPDNSTQYNVAVTASDPDGGADVAIVHALINHDGPNAGQNRGYVIWSPTNYFANSSYQDQTTCSDGTFAAVSTSNGAQYVHLKGCSSSLSGNSRTATFTLTFDPTFTSPTTNNDISALAQDVRTGYYGWYDLATYFNLNFAVPVISSLSPASGSGGGPAFTLTVNGSGFTTASTVNWNGAARTTTYVGPNQLTAAISAADIATPGTNSVTVVTPAPGGGTSNTVSFPVTCATPTVNITGSLSGSLPAGVQICADGTNCVAPSGSTYSLPVTSAASHTVSSLVPAGSAVSPGPTTVTVVCNNATGPTFNYTTSTTCP